MDASAVRESPRRLLRGIPELGAADWVWSAALGFLFGLSPLTGAGRVWASAILGTAIGFIVLGRRALLAASGRKIRPASVPVLEWPGPTVAVALLAVVAAFGPTLLWLYEEYTTSIWRNGHGLFLPVVVALLARSILRKDASSSPESSPWGFAFLGVGLSLLVIDSGVQSRFISVLGLIVVLPGLSLLLLGARRTRALAYPLALMLFAFPVPIGIVDPLRLVAATAVGMDVIVQWFDIAAIRHQSLFFIPEGFIGVSQNCSGIGTFYAAMGLAVVLWPVCGSRARRVAMLLAPWPVTVLVNSVRGAFLVYGCDRYGISFLHLPIHGLSGIFAFWVVMGVVFLLADRRGTQQALF